MAIRTQMTLGKINTKINTELKKLFHIVLSNGLNINMKLKN